MVSYTVTNPDARTTRCRRSSIFDDNIPNQATARAMLNDEGEIVRVIHGPVPLSGERRGEDVMLTDALGFDLRVYDPARDLCPYGHGAVLIRAIRLVALSVVLTTDRSGSG